MEAGDLKFKDGSSLAAQMGGFQTGGGGEGSGWRFRREG